MDELYAYACMHLARVWAEWDCLYANRNSSFRRRRRRQYLLGASENVMFK